MRREFWVQWGLGLVAIGSVAPGYAQTQPVEIQTPKAQTAPIQTAQTTDSPSTPASTVSTRAAVFIPARAGAGYSTSGGGYDGFGSFEGFIPLQQTPGKDLWYLVGRFLLDNDANLGGNVLLGYRIYRPDNNLIYGGYLGYDTRNTGESTFSQLGLGFEAMGDGWDARLNGYIPFGDTRQTIAEQVFNTGVQFSDLRFQDHFLRASGNQQQRVLRRQEVAVGGFDLEGGGRLLRFSNGGDLWGYAGLYYLAGGGESSAGVRGRLQARPLDFLTLGVTLQHDGIFGTNVIGTIALTFPNQRPKGVAPTSVQARLGEMPQRVNAIAVDNRVEVQQTSRSFVDTILTNPATGQPYFFQHVVLGTSGGNGTVESPFGQVQPALSATRSDGNDIVYVQAGSNPGIPAFTIPDRVQVLSTGPSQLLPATISGVLNPAYVLPLSGGGTLPSVTGTVTMGSDTVLSGFSITSTGAGVTFNNVNRVEIRDNVIANTGNAGILGNGVAIANLFRNQITAARNQGIFLQNVGIANVTDNVVRNTVAGTATIANPITDNITIGSITIPNPGSIIPLPAGQGIAIVTSSGDVTLARNTISGTGTQGIVLLNGDGNVSVTDNSVANTIGADFPVNLTTTVPPLGVIPVPTGQGIVVAGVDGNVEVSRNTVNTVRGQGLSVVRVVNGTTTVSNNTIRNTVDQGMVVGSTSGTTTIANNQISDVATRNQTIPNPTGIGPANLTVATGQGLVLLNSIGTVNVTGNTIERVNGAFSTSPAPDSGQGIAVANFSGQVNLNITNNQLRNNYNDGILIGLAGRTSGTTTPANATITITNNTIANNGSNAPTVRGDGIAIGLEQDSVISNLLIENNTISGNGDEGIDIRLGLQAAPLINPTTARLTGTIRNNTITANGQNGIQVQANGGTRANVAITSNTSSNNGEQGIFLLTSSTVPLIGSPQLSASVQNNTLNANTLSALQAQTSAALAAQAVCVNLAGNSGSTLTLTNASILTTLSIVGANYAAVTTNNSFTTYNPVTAPIVPPTFTFVPSCP